MRENNSSGYEGLAFIMIYDVIRRMETERKYTSKPKGEFKENSLQRH